MEINCILSQVFGGLAAASRPLVRYGQSKYPDTTNIRRLNSIPNALLSLSYMFNVKGAVPALITGNAAIRSGLLATPWGKAHKKKIVGTLAAISTVVGSAMYEEPIDSLPIIGTLINSSVEYYQDEARYQRLPLLFAFLMWGPVAWAKGNDGALVSTIVSAGITWNTAYIEDMNGASGKNNAPFWEDFRAYRYGIWHKAPTGAKIKGQVSTAPGYTEETMRTEYIQKLRDKPNPYFVTQSKVLARLESGCDTTFSQPSPQTPDASARDNPESILDGRWWPYIALSGATPARLHGWPESPHYH